MVHNLDEVFTMSPRADAKWARLSTYQKLLVSFIFFEIVLPGAEGKLHDYPDLILRSGRKLPCLGIDLGFAHLIIAIPNDRDRYILLDFEVDVSLLFTLRPPSSPH
jgi:hypothetical protein